MTPQQISLYLQRIQCALSLSTPPSLDILEILHSQHVFQVPFENFDVYTPAGVVLNRTHLFDKIVRRRRGGYCFELNELFASLLESLGFQLQRCLGRVWFLREENAPVPPRTHQLSIIVISEKRYLVDVGFGNGLVLPLEIRDGQVQAQFGRQFRCQKDARFGYRLELYLNDHWKTLYTFTDELGYPEDFKIANHFTSRHPDSGFMQRLVCTKPTPEGRLTLHNRQFKIQTGKFEEVQEIPSSRIYRELLRQYFGVELPSDYLFPCFEEE